MPSGWKQEPLLCLSHKYLYVSVAPVVAARWLPCSFLVISPLLHHMELLLAEEKIYKKTPDFAATYQYCFL